MANESQRFWDLLTNRLTAVYGATEKAAIDLLDDAGYGLEALDTELGLIPQSGGNTSWNATALAAIQAEVEYALEDAGQVMVITTIATLASQTGFTLTAGSADDDAYNGMLAVIENASEATQKAIGVISDYTGASKTITLREDPGIFTMAEGDKISIIVVSPDILAIRAITDTLTLAALEAEAVDALESFDLDRLLKVALGDGLATFVGNDTVLGHLLAEADVANFVRATHSLEAIGDAVAALTEAGLRYGSAITGSVTPEDGTEQDIVADTAGAGDYAQDFEIFLSIDLSVMDADDTVVIKVYKTVDGTNPRLADTQEFSGVQTIECWEMDALWGDEVMDLRVTLAQTAQVAGYKTFHYRGGVRKPSS